MIYYTDGSCTGNGKSVNEGGYGVVVLDDNQNLITTYSKRNQNTTNNREEIRAILYVMLTAGVYVGSGDWSEIPVVYSDSAYCVNTFNDWMFRWAQNNWVKSDKKVPENLDLIQAYYEHYTKGYRIDLRKVQGHAGNKWNELADKLATGKITTEEAQKNYGRYFANTNNC